MAKYSKVKAIKDFFGMSSRETMDEYKQLNEDEKLELAQGSAKNLGLTQDECDFELS